MSCLCFVQVSRISKNRFFVISLRRVVALSPKIVIKLPGTYEKLHCKGEPDRLSGQRDPSVQTNILLLYYKDVKMSLVIIYSTKLEIRKLNVWIPFILVRRNHALSILSLEIYKQKEFIHWNFLQRHCSITNFNVRLSDFLDANKV